MTFTPKKQPQSPNMSGRGASREMAGEAKNRATANPHKARTIVAKQGRNRKLVSLPQGVPGRKGK